MSSTPAGFANHVMQSALLSSHCIFLGLSLRDINILRWLGLRGIEQERSFINRSGMQFMDASETVRQADSWRRRALAQHYWVTHKPDPLLREILSLRGVSTIEASFSEDEVRAVFSWLGLAD